MSITRWGILGGILIATLVAAPASAEAATGLRSLAATPLPPGGMEGLILLGGAALFRLVKRRIRHRRD